MGSRYRTLSRFYQGNSFDIDLDAAGRVTLPPPLLGHAGIEKEVVVVGGWTTWRSGTAALERPWRTELADRDRGTEELGHPS